jgi:hypothetical protein
MLEVCLGYSKLEISALPQKLQVNHPTSEIPRSLYSGAVRAGAGQR